MSRTNASIENFDKKTIQGQANLKILKDLKKSNTILKLMYLLIAAASITTSGYASWITGSIVGGLLITITELIRWSSTMNPYNKYGVMIATILSVTTAAFSGIMLHNTHNKIANNSNTTIEQLQQELDSINRMETIESGDLITTQNQVAQIQSKINEILKTPYNIKRWSRTESVTGLKIAQIKNCGKSTTCNKVQAQIIAYQQQLSIQKEKQSFIKAGIKQTQQNHIRKQELQNQLIASRGNNTKIVMPFYMSLTMILLLIFSIDYSLVTIGLKKAAIRDPLESKAQSFKVWLFHQKEIQRQQKELEIIERKGPKQKLDSDEKIETVINSMINAKEKFTVSKAKKHLKLLNFYVSDKNAAIVLDYQKMLTQAKQHVQTKIKKEGLPNLGSTNTLA